MRSLCIDFGQKRLGLAICDDAGMIAVPLKVLPRLGDRKDAAALLEEVRATRALRVVFGLPTNAQGGAVHHADEVKSLADALRGLLSGIEIFWWDERFSTAEAKGRQRALGISSRDAKDSIDAHAAAVILQGYLDAQRPVFYEDED